MLFLSLSQLPIHSMHFLIRLLPLHSLPLPILQHIRMLLLIRRCLLHTHVQLLSHRFTVTTLPLQLLTEVYLLLPLWGRDLFFTVVLRLQLFYAFPCFVKLLHHPFVVFFHLHCRSLLVSQLIILFYLQFSEQPFCLLVLLKHFIPLLLSMLHSAVHLFQFVVKAVNDCIFLRQN